MKKDHIVKLVVECINFVKREEDINTGHSLRGLLSYVDYKDRTIPSLEEILCGVQMVEDIHLVKIDRMIYFTYVSGAEGQVETITEEDLKYANKEYTKKF